MEYKFGEFNSARELNMAAEGQKAEGDKDALIALAIENGIDKYEAMDYFDGETEQLCTPLMAALGKISVEETELNAKEIMADWVTYIKVQCEDNPKMAYAVREKGKSLKECISKLLNWGFGHQIPVDKEILEAANIRSGKVTLGIPGMGTAKKIIKDYYLKKA